MIETYLYYSISLYATVVFVRAAQFLIVINLLIACILNVGFCPARMESLFVGLSHNKPKKIGGNRNSSRRYYNFHSSVWINLYFL
jgi:hypothetical protein